MIYILSHRRNNIIYLKTKLFIHFKNNRFYIITSYHIEYTNRWTFYRTTHSLRGNDSLKNNICECTILYIHLLLYGLVKHKTKL
ncbi:hypothetical protein GDO81_008122 [Engystomops pustulosus]|uniref:Uncharacterized protein n=1 Tax=Engystomops pustulosus TaxID=76066 RepID=A0AAV7CC82_ENGPU|nr:hypothetical protein GDO81_008122 [Engystomops pustulosus]